MNIRFLETVVWLAHYRNFRMTGERLHLTQPAISSRIQQVEQELGVRLFDRQGREVVLTLEGEAFVADAREIVRRHEALLERHRPAKDLGGLVRIGLSSSMAHLLLPEIVGQLREQHPEIRLEITIGDTMNKFDLMLGGGIDICLMAHHFDTREHLRIEPLCKLGMGWVASPTLLVSSDFVYTAADLRMIPIITYAAGTLNATRINAFFGAHIGEVRQLITSDAFGTSLAMAVRGIGAAVLPLALAQPEIAAGNLVTLKTSPAFLQTDYVAVWPDASRHPGVGTVARLATQAARRLMHQFSSDLVLV
jgi:DNA-binding transcriptional LysR family regulator